MHFEGDKVRQVGFNLADISPHHLSRYFFAASLVNYGNRIVDIGCGCGYGTWLLWAATGQATGIDISKEAIDWARQYYPGPNYILANAGKLDIEGDVAVVFEVIEHIEDPKSLLSKMKVKHIVCSVPNQNNYPFNPEDFKGDGFPHLRHYTPEEFEELLTSAGFTVGGKFCQRSKAKNGVYPGTDGKFLVYLANRE